jgi:hypothetical protein
VQDNAADLACAVRELTNAVVKAVRSSATEVDRRRTHGFKIEQRCYLSIPGQGTHTARIGYSP